MKIPDSIIRYIKENLNPQYKWNYDEEKSVADQEVSKDTFSLFLFILDKYVATPEEKKELHAILKENTAYLNQHFSASEQLVNLHPINKPTSEQQTVNTAIAKKDSFWIRIKQKFRNLFHR